MPTEPTRFAYVDAGGIRERRLAASGDLAPPITGIHISESFWNKWEDQWAQAQEAGVLLEAVAVYLPRELVADGPPAGFRAVVRLPWRMMKPSSRNRLERSDSDPAAGAAAGGTMAVPGSCGAGNSSSVHI